EVAPVRDCLGHLNLFVDAVVRPFPLIAFGKCGEASDKKRNVMRTIFLAATVILPLLAGDPAQAADMAAKAPTYNPQPPVVYNWTGCYVGGHLGGGATTSDWRAIDVGG